MRKRIVGLHHGQQAGESGQGWLDLEEIATVEVTSEDPASPLNRRSVRKKGQAGGRLKKVNSRSESSSMSSVSLQRIQLRFREPDSERLQEFVIRWSPAAGGAAA